MTNTEDLTFQLLAENSFDLLCRIDMDTTIRYASPSSERILGWTPNELCQNLLSDFVLPEDLPVLHAAAQRANSPGVPNASATLRLRRKTGPPCWLEINATIVRDPESGKAITAAVIMRDITDRKLLEDKLATLALTDGLTGLANRRAFDMTLDTEWKRTLREGSHMSLVLLDLDHFKQFNDNYGHQFGDDCLRAVAQAVRNTVHRPSDLAARYGGEEIAVILPYTHQVGAVEIAENIRQAIADLRIPHFGNREQGSVVTASLGAATAFARQGAVMKMPESLLMSGRHRPLQGQARRPKSGRLPHTHGHAADVRLTPTAQKGSSTVDEPFFHAADLTGLPVSPTPVKPAALRRSAMEALEAAYMLSATFMPRVPNVPLPVTRLVPLEVLEWLRATVRKRSVVPKVRVIPVVHMPVKPTRPMKPRPGSDEQATRKPVRPIVAIRRAVIRCVIKVAVRTLRRRANVDRNLSR